MQSKPTTQAEKATGTIVDTIIFSPEEAQAWRPPPFQRPLKVNEKVKALAQTILVEKGVIPGIITLGRITKDPALYIVDGQHRVQAFILSGADCGYADVRILSCQTMGDLGEEFVRLNSHLVRMSSDDILRGMESSTPLLQTIRKECPFIGYDSIRRRGTSAVFSVSQALRSWYVSGCDVPGHALSASSLAVSMTAENVGHMVTFLKSCEKAWGRDQEYWPLWTSLNMVICGWIYRHQILVTPTRVQKYKQMDQEQWHSAMAALSSDRGYLDWLIGRRLGDRDRSPCYNRIKTIMGKKILDAYGFTMVWIQPSWANSVGGRKN